VLQNPLYRHRSWKKEQATRTTVRVVGYEPRVAVADVARAVEHYRKLGLEISFHDDTYAFAHRDRLTVHLAQADESESGQSTIYLHVDDAARLAADWRAAGFEVEGTEDTDYRKREGSHRDPDGNLLRFGSPLRGG
jgi:catechol 2,3-dioxygenase-like lactoylglutathione lyase family enzyme